MAHVAISNHFIERVVDKIARMEKAELNTLGTEPAIVVSIDSPPLVNAIWGQHIHLKDMVPRDWCNVNGTARLAFDTTSTQTNSDGKEAPVSCGFTVSAPPDQHFKFVPNSYWHTAFKIRPEDVDHPDIKEAIAYGNAKAEIGTRWANVRLKVTEFFKSCKSMKEAVTLWPECKAYIDNEDIERFEKKVTKTASSDSEAAKVLAGMNTDELMGAAVVARLSGVA